MAPRQRHHSIELSSSITSPAISERASWLAGCQLCLVRSPLERVTAQPGHVSHTFHFKRIPPQEEETRCRHENTFWQVRNALLTSGMEILRFAEDLLVLQGQRRCAQLARLVQLMLVPSQAVVGGDPQVNDVHQKGP